MSVIENYFFKNVLTLIILIQKVSEAGILDKFVFLVLEMQTSSESLKDKRKRALEVNQSWNL